eukprot:TRINITY_DN4997_c0_g1_i2.p4 TRINITY_DN4997_c0_g1~~TRINITY_DN4997_c0_g1_i2.p4  ORF type:complete len:103 (+),score=1.34 TRINITY_DN4997_c0_g1_i2:30-311(+)
MVAFIFKKLKKKTQAFQQIQFLNNKIDYFKLQNQFQKIMEFFEQFLLLLISMENNTKTYLIPQIDFKLFILFCFVYRQNKLQKWENSNCIFLF